MQKVTSDQVFQRYYLLFVFAFHAHVLFYPARSSVPTPEQHQAGGMKLLLRSHYICDSVAIRLQGMNLKIIARPRFAARLGGALQLIE